MSVGGAAVGATTAVINGATNRHGTEKDVLVGAACGALGPICGGAGVLGADVSYSVGLVHQTCFLS